MRKKTFIKILERQERRVVKMLPKVKEDTYKSTTDVKKVSKEEVRDYFLKKALEQLEPLYEELMSHDPSLSIGLRDLAYLHLRLLYSTSLVRRAIKVMESPPQERPILFTMDSRFLAKAMNLVEFNHQEEAVLVTGIDLGTIKVLTDFLPLEKHSTAVSINALPEMMEKALRKLETERMPLLGVFHSHPGHGPQNPSPIDLNNHETWEVITPLLGAVMTNDGYVTFYSKNLDFEIFIQGNVKRESRNVFKLTDSGG